MSGECYRCWVLYNRQTPVGKGRFWSCDECYGIIDLASKNAIKPGGLEDLDLSTRAYNCLQSVGIGTISELRQWDMKALLRIKNMGRKTLVHIQGCLNGSTTQEAEIRPGDWVGAA